MNLGPADSERPTAARARARRRALRARPRSAATAGLAGVARPHPLRGVPGWASRCGPGWLLRTCWWSVFLWRSGAARCPGRPRPGHDRANLLEVRHERAACRNNARCSTDQQDLTAQRDALSGLGVEVDRIYVDHGLTGTNRERPGLREALAACRAEDTLVVTKLNRRHEAHLVSLVHSGEYSTLEVAELFGVGPSTVHRAIERQRVEARAGLAGGDIEALTAVQRRRLSRVRHPSGTPASRHCRMSLSALLRFGLWDGSGLPKSTEPVAIASQRSRVAQIAAGGRGTVRSCLTGRAATKKVHGQDLAGNDHAENLGGHSPGSTRSADWARSTSAAYVWPSGIHFVSQRSSSA